MKSKNVNKEKEDVLKKFGSNFRRIRLEKGMKTSELAYLCDIERHHINRYESGKLNPTLYSLYKIAEALEVTFEDLLKDLK